MEVGGKVVNVKMAQFNATTLAIDSQTFARGELN